MSESEARMSESEARMSESEARMSESEARMSESEARMSESEARMSGPSVSSLFRVRRIQLKNWQGHREEDVHLPAEGVILLWGPSGAGKTSLLEAVSMALYGPKAISSKSTEELRHECWLEERTEVRVTFEIGSGELTVERSLGKNAGALLVEPDGTQTKGIQAVTERVTELLGGMDGTTFFATYFSQQGELDALVKMASGGRRKFVQRMMGIQLLDAVLSTIRKQASRKSELLNNLGERLEAAESEEQLEEAILQADSLAAQGRLSLEGLAAEQEAAQMEWEVRHEAYAAGKEAASRYSRLGPFLTGLRETVIPTLESQLEELRARAGEAGEAETRVLAAREEIGELAALREEHALLGASAGALASLQASRARVLQATKALEQHEIPPKGEDPLALERELKEQAPLLQDLRGEYQRLSAQLSELEENAAQLAERGECALCLRELEGEAGEQVNTRLRERSELLRERRERVREDGRLLGERLEELQQRERAAERAREERERSLQLQAKLQAELTRAQTELEEEQARAQQANPQRLEWVQSRLAELSRLEAGWEADRRLALTLPQLRERVSGIEKQLRERREEERAAEQEMHELEFDPHAHAEAERAQMAAQGRMAELREEQRRIGLETQAAENQASSARERLQRARGEQEQRDSIAAQLLLLGRLEESMRGFKLHMIGLIRPELEARTSHHLSELSEGAMQVVAIDDDYNLSIERNGALRRISTFSGGQQARAALALRLALTQLVSSRTDTPIGFIIFDEIFGTQDPEHRRAILESFRYLRALYPQSFIISHEESMRDSELVDVLIDIPDSDGVQRIVVQAR